MDVGDENRDADRSCGALENGVPSARPPPTRPSGTRMFELDGAAGLFQLVHGGVSVGGVVRAVMIRLPLVGRGWW